MYRMNKVKQTKIQQFCSCPLKIASPCLVAQMVVYSWLSKGHVFKLQRGHVLCGLNALSVCFKCRFSQILVCTG